MCKISPPQQYVQILRYNVQNFTSIAWQLFTHKYAHQLINIQSNAYAHKRINMHAKRMNSVCAKFHKYVQNFTKPIFAHFCPFCAIFIQSPKKFHIYTDKAI